MNRYKKVSKFLLPHEANQNTLKRSADPHTAQALIKGLRAGWLMRPNKGAARQCPSFNYNSINPMTYARQTKYKAPLQSSHWRSHPRGNLLFSPGAWDDNYVKLEVTIHKARGVHGNWSMVWWVVRVSRDWVRDSWVETRRHLSFFYISKLYLQWNNVSVSSLVENWSISLENAAAYAGYMVKIWPECHF